jgi:REP element-mobilizing transposase RayT
MVTQTDPKGWHSRGYLPHFDSPEVAQHVVFRTAGPLPKEIRAALAGNEPEAISAFDAWLDGGAGDGPLFKPEHAEIVADSLRFFEGSRYRLHAWCVMPNHMHVVVTMLAGFRLGDTVRSWKAFSAAKINRANGLSGPFWARDYFDRFMRDETDFAQTVGYVERNPVLAGLVDASEEWLWSSAHERASLDREPSGSPFRTRA